MRVYPEVVSEFQVNPQVGRPDVDIEIYFGWQYPGDMHAAFEHMFAVMPEFYFRTDAMLMFYSKGGIRLENLIGNRTIGQRTRELYLEQFQQIVKDFYGSSDGQEGGDSTDNAQPPLPGM